MENKAIIKVAKFGGSSLADAEHFIKVKNIITSDSSRRYVVPSAPGKRFEGDVKVTDLLYETCQAAIEGESIDPIFELVKARYVNIIDELGLDLDLEEEFVKIKKTINETHSKDYAASRGEYLNGIVLAKYLGFDFVDAADVIFFNEKGMLDSEKTNEIMSDVLRGHACAVIPGFYGTDINGNVKTFSRGGSDISGSIVARAVVADLYENWTDVSGFLKADPRMVMNPRPIEIITYNELRELAYMGATVLHEDAIFPVRIIGIPINIRNTNRPDDKGTMIVLNKPEGYEQLSTITGIAGRKGFSVITVEKDLMNAEIGFVRKVLSIFEKYEISFEHLPSGIDSIGIVVSTTKLESCKDALIEEIYETVNADKVIVEDGLSLVAVVGCGMVNNCGTAARIFTAIAKNNINIRMIDQGSGEFNIIISVADKDMIRTVNAIYHEFEMD